MFSDLYTSLLHVWQDLQSFMAIVPELPYYQKQSIKNSQIFCELDNEYGDSRKRQWNIHTQIIVTAF